MPSWPDQKHSNFDPIKEKLLSPEVSEWQEDSWHQKQWKGNIEFIQKAINSFSSNLLSFNSTPQEASCGKWFLLFFLSNIFVVKHFSHFKKCKQNFSDRNTSYLWNFSTNKNCFFYGSRKSSPQNRFESNTFYEFV